MIELTDEHRKFAVAIYQDFKQSYPQMTLDMVLGEAVSIINGNAPKGIIGISLVDVYKRAGLI